MRRRPVRSPDLLHTFAALGAQKALKEDPVPPLPGPAEALEEQSPSRAQDIRSHRCHLKTPCKELSKHDLEIVKRSVKTEMGGGYGQVYAWFGTGAKEHWADSIALGIVTAREGVLDTDWVHQVRLAVYVELGLETVDVAFPFRMSDLTGSKI